MVDAAETRKAAFTIFPRSSIFSIIVIAGTGLTMPIRRPAALLSFMPVFLPIKESGFLSTRCKSSAVGRLPSSTMPMDETTAIASSSGARSGSSEKPVI